MLVWRRGLAFDPGDHVDDAAEMHEAAGLAETFAALLRSELETSACECAPRHAA